MKRSLIHALRVSTVLLCATLALAGCQSAQTLSLAVRTGDTVIVGLTAEAGAPYSNTTAKMLRPADFSARITDAGGVTSDVKIRAVVKVYGDPTANNFAANKGQWIAVIDLVNAGNQPLNLSTGPASLTLNSNKLINPLVVTTTILAGTGQPHPLTGSENGLDKMRWLSPAQQALVTISGSIGAQRVGAVQYEFSVPAVAENSAFGLLSAIEGIKLQGRRDINFQSWTRLNSSGGTDLYVIMTAPNGVRGNELRELDMALVAGRLAIESNPSSYFNGSLRSATFYNTDGEVLPGLQAAIGPVE